MAIVGITSLLFAGVGCGGEDETTPTTPIGNTDDGQQPDTDLTGSYRVGTALETTTDVNLRKAPNEASEILLVVPANTTVYSGSSYPRDGWYGITWHGKTGWIKGTYLKKIADSKASLPPGPSDISATGQRQMRDVVTYARSHNSGASRGRCFEYVWRYLTSSTYGNLNDYHDAADMQSAYARNFAEYMNVRANADLWGLRRLNIANPYDAPAGAVVVVAPGTPGTSHPTAGDIAIATGSGQFINDGPSMSYGGSRSAFERGGKLLGAYVPK